MGFECCFMHKHGLNMLDYKFTKNKVKKESLFYNPII